MKLFSQHPVLFNTNIQYIYLFILYTMLWCPHQHPGTLTSEERQDTKQENVTKYA